MKQRSTSKPVRDPAALQRGVAKLARALQHERQRQWITEHILAHIGDPVVLVDRQFVVQYWNPAAEATYRWTAAEAVGQPLDDLVHTHYIHGTTAGEVRATLERNGAWTGLVEQQTRDGRTLLVESTVRALRDTRGVVHILVGINRDMTQRLQNEAHYRKLLEHLPVVVFQAPFENVNVSSYVSPQIVELLGYTPEEWLAEPAFWLSRVHPDDRAQILDIQERFQQTGAPQVSEHRMLAKDGRVVWVHDEAVVVRDSPAQAPYVLGITRDITARKEAEATLRLRDQAIATLRIGLVVMDAQQPELPIIDVNRAFTQITGYDPADVRGRSWQILHGPDTDPDALASINSCLIAGSSCEVVLKSYRANGVPFWNELAIAPVNTPDGQITHVVGLMTDITERRQLEARMLQAQKMESVGQLAAGIAHDFNNLLTVIGGSTELAQSTLPADHPAQGDLRDVLMAARRAAALTRQLLVFARKQELEPQIMAIDMLLVDTERLLQRVLGSDIVLNLYLAPDLPAVKIDPNQIEQVLVNLAVNARDAMPNGGTLMITAETIMLHADEAGLHSALEPGTYVHIVVGDTGCGMPPEVCAHALVPFFTTKPPGKGTGLGLATCYGIVKQHGGTLWIYSEVDRGTAIHIYLPAAHAAANMQDARADGATGPPSGTETLLLVEDDASLRGFAARVLRELGYTVLEAGNGIDALRIAETIAYDLLITDVVMPRLGGTALAERLRATRPRLKVLFMSGYSEHPSLERAHLQAGAAMLQKPFGGQELARRVRAALDAATPADVRRT